jgi:hypothetical protein
MHLASAKMIDVRTGSEAAKGIALENLTFSGSDGMAECYVSGAQ